MVFLSSFSKHNSESLSVAIVGATGGVGSALIQQLALSSTINRIYCCSRSVFDTDSVNKASETPHTSLASPSYYKDRLTYLPIDIADEDSIKKSADIIASHHIKLDIVIVVTGLLHVDGGIQPEKSLRQLSPENFIKSVTVNTLGPALVAKHFLPLMHNKQRAFFGALSARVGSISDNGLGGWHSYRASKSALNMLIKNIAIEYKRKCPDLVVAGLHPGTVNTELSVPFQRNVAPEKLFSADFSAERILDVINNLESEDSGNCFAWDGKKIPA